MGNSEVGHEPRCRPYRLSEPDPVDAAIEDGSFFENPGCARPAGGEGKGGTLHVMGLLSPGRVHSHEQHIFAMLELAHRAGVSHRSRCTFLDGRDPPQSAEGAPAHAAGQCELRQCAHRHHRRTLFRDGSATKRWEAVNRVGRDRRYRRRTRGAGRSSRVAGRLRARRDRRVRRADLVDGGAPMPRWRCGGVHEFPRRPRAPAGGGVRRLLRRLRPAPARCRRFVCLTEYDARLGSASVSRRTTCAIPSASAGARGPVPVARAETEKYAHVTFFFFSGGREASSPASRASSCPARRSRLDLQPE